MKKVYFIFLITLISACLSAQEVGHFTNPVIRGDIADPSIIRIGDTYYATGTSSEWAPHYPFFISRDLINWEQTGYVFAEKPEWTSNSFWAPELFYHNNRLYCYYTARKKSNGVSYIGVASADSPSDVFVDHGPIVEYGTEAIDAFIYDDNGQLYISWKAYGLDQRPIELLASKLSDDGLRLEGEPFSLLKDDERIGMEGQYHFKNGDFYYIVYSTRGCCGFNSDYDVCVARSKDFKGPYVKYSKNPILSGAGVDYISCGHGTAVTTPDNRMFYMCHAYLKGDDSYVGRQPILQEMFITEDNWVQFTTGDIAVVEQLAPNINTEQKQIADFTDDFLEPIININFIWNFPYSDIKATIKDGELLLAGQAKDRNNYGTALCIRPQSPNYTYETQVTNQNESFKGLTMYGDDENLVVWGIEGDKLLLKEIKDKKESILYETVCKTSNIYLKVEVKKGHMLNFYQSKDGQKWETAIKNSFDAGYTVRWDRVARPGLIHIGKVELPASFSYFNLTNVK